jgi:hypothetical protein
MVSRAGVLDNPTGGTVDNLGFFLRPLHGFDSHDPKKRENFGGVVVPFFAGICDFSGVN